MPKPHRRNKFPRKPAPEASKPDLPGFGARRCAAILVEKTVDQHESIDQLTTGSTAIGVYRALEPQDRGLARAIALATLRHYRRIGEVLSRLYNRKPPKNARYLVHTLEVAAAQILYMNVPASAAVNLAVSAINRDKRTARFTGFANAVLRKLADETESLRTSVDEVSPFPAWMAKKLVSGYGKKLTAEMGMAVSNEPNVDLVTRPGAENVLPADFATVLPMGILRLTTATPVTELPGYEAGQWWVQDIAASLPARLLGDVTGKQIADLCAAPGGKTMQLASLGANVTAVDISRQRLGRLTENLKRTGLSAEIVQADILEWEPDERFDAILLDAPCTATGTVRRHPDVLWNKTPENLDELVALQRALIHRAARLLKPGGTLIYANCSLFREEGEDIAANPPVEGMVLDPILPAELPGLEFCINRQGTMRCLPHFLGGQHAEGGMDGFFAARFIVG